MIQEWIHKYPVRINMIGFREIEKPLKNIYIAFMEYKFRYRNLFWRNKQFGLYAYTWIIILGFSLPFMISRSNNRDLRDEWI